MAIDNFASFSRFARIDPNIAQHGVTVEELKSAAGSPDPNPVLSPMARPRVSETRLALENKGSDNLRLAIPEQPAPNPYEGPKRTRTLNRNAVTKLQGNIIGQLKDVVQSGKIGSAEAQKGMHNSLFERVGPLCDMLTYLGDLGDFADSRMIGNSKA